MRLCNGHYWVKQSETRASNGLREVHDRCDKCGSGRYQQWGDQTRELIRTRYDLVPGAEQNVSEAPPSREEMLRLRAELEEQRDRLRDP